MARTGTDGKYFSSVHQMAIQQQIPYTRL